MVHLPGFVPGISSSFDLLKGVFALCLPASSDDFDRTLLVEFVAPDLKLQFRKPALLEKDISL